MVWHVFMVITVGIVLPIMYFVLKHYGTPEGDRLFGITIGVEHMKEETVQKIQKTYIKEMNGCALGSLAVMIAMLFIRYESLFYLVLMFLLFGIIFVFEVPFMKASSAVKLKKLEMGWNGAEPKGSSIHVEYAKRKQAYLKKGWLVGGLATLILAILIVTDYVLPIEMRLVLIVASICYLTFLLCWSFYIAYQAYQVPVAPAEEGREQDDDDYWMYGMFYYNKKDSHFLVEKRVGIGTTVNMARPAAKVSAVLLAIIMLFIPFSSIWLVADEFTPVSLTIDTKEIKSKQFEGTYTIPVSEIETVEVLNTLPDHDKLVGTALDNLYRGSFRFDGYDKCKVCLDPRNGYFLAVTMKDGKVYLLGDKTDKGTKAVYDKLLLLTNHL